jgi:hypothetical protein
VDGFNYYPVKHPCVIPVAAKDALSWAAGKLEDADLFLRSPLKPEAIFIVNLPCHSAWRSCLRQMIYWHRRGAFTLITRTNTPVVVSHLEKNGAVATATETDTGKKRYMLPPHAMAKYFKPFN